MADFMALWFNPIPKRVRFFNCQGFNGPPCAKARRGFFFARSWVLYRAAASEGATAQQGMNSISVCEGSIAIIAMSKRESTYWLPSRGGRFGGSSERQQGERP